MRGVGEGTTFRPAAGSGDADATKQRRIASLVLAGTVVVYGTAALGLYRAARGDLSLLSLSLALLTALLLSLGMATLLAPSVAHRRFYLAAALLPIFTLVRLGLAASLPPPGELLLPYLVLAVVLLLYWRVTPLPRPGVDPVRLVRAARYALPVAFLVGLTQLLLFTPHPSYPWRDAWLAALVAAFIGLVDEGFFRGVLQMQAEEATRPIWGYLAATGLFVAAFAATGDPTTVLFQAGVGLLLGYLVWRHRDVPLVLLIRAVSAGFVALLAPLAIAPL